MPHLLTVGMTESGKTSFNKRLAAAYKAAGVGVLVLDPLNDPSWPCDFRTADPNLFLDVYWKSRKCAAFIDEGSQVAGRYDNAMISTATQGRHWGHNNHYITQRPVGISPTIRDQCALLAVFTMNGEACKMLAADFNKPEIKQATEFPAGTYLYCGRYLPPKICKLF